MGATRNWSRFSLAACTALLFAIFFGAVRPWYLSWGASASELIAALPGDTIIPNAASQQTRAITINAPIERVWPWIAQIGQDRGGFYSYDLLENLVGCEMPTIDILRPEKQQWTLGDRLWMYPPAKAGGIGFGTLREFIPGRALAFGTRTTGTTLADAEDASWTFVLEPLDAGTTRLLIRGRGAAGRSLLGVAFDRSVFEPMHFAMERRMMTGIKQLAETGVRSREQNHLDVVLWTVVWLVTAWAFVCVGILRSGWRGALRTFVLGAVALQLLTMGQPQLPTAVAITALLLVVAGLSAKRGQKIRYRLTDPVEGAPHLVFDGAR